MRVCRVFLSLLLLGGVVILPTSTAHATGWSPIADGTSCIEGTTGTTGLRESGANYGFGDSWLWTGISGDENDFSLTFTYTEGGAPFDSGYFYEFWIAFREAGEPCSAGFFPWLWYSPPPPAARFVPTTECTLSATGSAGSSTGTVSLVDLDVDKPEFQKLKLELAPQTSAGTHTYTIDFVCGETDDPGNGDTGGPSWDIDRSYYLTRAASAPSSDLPDTL